MPSPPKVTITCADCGKRCKRARQARRCEPCAKKRQLALTDASRRRLRQGGKPRVEVRTFRCQWCKEETERRGSAAKYCEPCSEAIKVERRREANKKRIKRMTEAEREKRNALKRASYARLSKDPEWRARRNETIRLAAQRRKNTNENEEN